jgi:alpha-beta hydrolase superfamily lysophospholipase
MHCQRIALMANSVTFHLEAFCADDDAALATLLVLPGADCTAQRYRWLAEAFTPLGVATCIIDPPLLQREALLEPGKVICGQFVGVVELQAALIWLAGARPGRPVVLVGHSLGGVVMMEWLDQQAAMRNPLNRAVCWQFELQAHVVAAVTMGTTLQQHALGISFPWRSEEASLTRPARLPVLMLAGQNDAMVAPELVMATARRYRPPASVTTLPGVCHFGWVEGHAPTDRIDLDGKSEVPKAEQFARSATVIGEFLRPILDYARTTTRRSS